MVRTDEGCFPMSNLFVSGHIIDLILVGMVIETFAVIALRSKFGRGPIPSSFVSNVLSGAFLLLAVRSALTGTNWTLIALCLLAALVWHIVDLIFRFREVAPGASRWNAQPFPQSEKSLPKSGNWVS
jgi:hypothetical protein